MIELFGLIVKKCHELSRINAKQINYLFLSARGFYYFAEHWKF